jgi:putative ABC transport system permease protein
MPVVFLLRDAWRSLTRSPRFIAIVTVVLGLAVDANASVFAVMKGAVLDPWPYRGADRIVTLRASRPTLGPDEFATFSAPEVRELQQMHDVFDGTLFGIASNVNLGADGRVDRVRGASISASAFDMLGVPPQFGRTFTDDEALPHGPHVVVMASRLWRSRYGADPSIIGRPIQIEGTPWTVIGVMPASFVFWDSQLYFPLGLDPADVDRHARRYYVQGRLLPGLSISSAAASLNGLSRRLEREHPEVVEYNGASLRVALLKDDVLRDVRSALIALSGATVLLLLMAIVNLANICITRGAGRRREIALRVALGASRARLIGQFAIEGLLLGAAAAGFGAALAASGVRAMVALIPYGYLPVEAHLDVDATILLLAAAIGLAAGFVLGVAPVLRFVRRDALDPALLRSARVIGDHAHHRVRRGLVVVQVAIALVVLSVAVGLDRGVESLLNAPAGFDARDVDTFRVALPRDAAADVVAARLAYEDVVRKTAAEPGVSAAAAATNVPLTGSLDATVAADSTPANGMNGQFDADTVIATPGYFAVLGIRLRSGRDFDGRDDAAAPGVALVNETLARRAWPGVDPVGRRVRITQGGDSDWRTVIGTVPDIKQQALDQPVRPAVYLPIAQVTVAPPTMAVVAKNASARRVTAAVAQTFVTGLAVYQAAPLTSIVADSLGGRRLAAVLFAVLGWVSAVLAVLGTAALLAFSVAERRKEIALRLALGAAPSVVARRLVSETVQLLALGSLTGAVLAFVAVRATGALFVTAKPGVAGAILIAGAVVVIGALLACVWPIRRAAAIDPAAALKES